MWESACLCVCVGVCTHKLCFQCSVCSENRECNSTWFVQLTAVFQADQKCFPSSAAEYGFCKVWHTSQDRVYLISKAGNITLPFYMVFYTLKTKYVGSGQSWTYLQWNMRCGTELCAWQLHVPIPTQEVNSGYLVTFAAVETGHAAANRLPSNHQALGAILAVRLVAGTRLQQDHWRRVLTEQPTEGGVD